MFEIHNQVKISVTSFENLVLDMCMLAWYNKSNGENMRKIS
jgi:hypothetical protein